MNEEVTYLGSEAVLAPSEAERWRSELANSPGRALVTRQVDPLVQG